MSLFTIKKNKIDLEHQALLQERNAILLAMVGVPLTFLNVLVTVVRIELSHALFFTLSSLWLLFIMKKRYDLKIRAKAGQLDSLL